MEYLRSKEEGLNDLDSLEAKNSTPIVMDDLIDEDSLALKIYSRLQGVDKIMKLVPFIKELEHSSYQTDFKDILTKKFDISDFNSGKEYIDSQQDDLRKKPQQNFVSYYYSKTPVYEVSRSNFLFIEVKDNLKARNVNNIINKINKDLPNHGCHIHFIKSKADKDEKYQDIFVQEVGFISREKPEIEVEKIEKNLNEAKTSGYLFRVLDVDNIKTDDDLMKIAKEKSETSILTLRQKHIPLDCSYLKEMEKNQNQNPSPNPQNFVFQRIEENSQSNYR